PTLSQGRGCGPSGLAHALIVLAAIVVYPARRVAVATATSPSAALAQAGVRGREQAADIEALVVAERAAAAHPGDEAVGPHLIRQRPILLGVVVGPFTVAHLGGLLPSVEVQHRGRTHQGDVVAKVPVAADTVQDAG